MAAEIGMKRVVCFIFESWPSFMNFAVTLFGWCVVEIRGKLLRWSNLGNTNSFIIGGPWFRNIYTTFDASDVRCVPRWLLLGLFCARLRSRFSFSSRFRDAYEPLYGTAHA